MEASNAEKSDVPDTEAIVKTAAHLLMKELKSATYDTSAYPPLSDIGDIKKNLEYLPKHLRIFLETLIKPAILQASIGQAIVHAVKPRSSLPPILLGTTIELDHLFGSTWLNSETNRLGWGLSPQEVTRFKQSVVRNELIVEYIKTAIKGNFFAQWSADNVDQIVRTLYGKGTLHGMGIVISLTGEKDKPFEACSKVFPREKLLNVSEVTPGKQVEFTAYIPPDETGLSKLTFLPFKDLKISFPKPADTCLDLL